MRERISSEPRFPGRWPFIRRLIETATTPPIAVPLVLAAGVPGLAYNLWIIGQKLVSGPDHDDFRDFFIAVRVAQAEGWPHLYDLAAAHRLAVALGLASGLGPVANPPPLAWLMLPVVQLPYRAAYDVWGALMVACLLGAWWLVTPREGWRQVLSLLAFLSFFVVMKAVVQGQIVPFVALCIALAWWLLERDRQVLAGLVLGGIALKPQIAILVPFALLAAGFSRTAMAWAVITLALALASGLQLGVVGLAGYGDELRTISHLDQPYMRVGGAIPIEGLALVLQLGMIPLTLLAAWRNRGHGAALPISAGLAGSLFVTPHVNPQDFTLLVLAGWLFLRTELWPVARWPFLVLGGAIVVFEVAVHVPGPLPAFEAAWVALLAMFPPRVPHPIGQEDLPGPVTLAPSPPVG